MVQDACRHPALTCSLRREVFSSAGITPSAVLKLCTCSLTGVLSIRERRCCIHEGGCTLMDTSSTPASTISVSAKATVRTVVHIDGLLVVIAAYRLLDRLPFLQ